jgi:hypothetical protein
MDDITDDVTSVGSVHCKKRFGLDNYKLLLIYNLGGANRYNHHD